MNAKYRELFTLIARTTSNLAEEVMNLHKQNEEEKEFKTAQVMRDDYLNLHDKLTSEEALTKADFARILVGAIIVANQLETRIKNDQKALQGYTVDIIPKLDQINNEPDEEKALKLASEIFEIKEDSEEENKNI